jgi:hypothetical protein
MTGMLGRVGLAATLGLLAWLNRRGLRRWQRANDRRARLREMEDEIRVWAMPAIAGETVRCLTYEERRTASCNRGQ